MSVYEAVEAEIARMGSKAVGSALAAMALRLAEQVDGQRGGMAGMAMVNKELRETLAQLVAVAPPAEEDNELERAKRRRAARNGLATAPDHASADGNAGNR